MQMQSTSLIVQKIFCGILFKNFTTQALHYSPCQKSLPQPLNKSRQIITLN